MVNTHQQNSITHKFRDVMDFIQTFTTLLYIPSFDGIYKMHVKVAANECLKTHPWYIKGKNKKLKVFILLTYSKSFKT